ncbi:MAG: DUF1249 domain-containing protein [Gammaproteobacteria bacterium]|jgi:uncharacterized protein YqiB (DUF1249 family)|nr:DUF1249 domain-containing protein [Gammaproteobacteria bacterium]
MLTTTRQLQPSSRILARRLPELHSALYRALNVLLPDALAESDHLVSRPGSGPELYLEVIERHPYTTFVRLSYIIGAERSHNPNAHVRIYHDAAMAEATAFSPQQGIQRFAGPDLAINGLVARSWRLNRALLKWVDYLIAQGHGAETMQPAGDFPSEISTAAPEA